MDDKSTAFTPTPNDAPTVAFMSRGMGETPDLDPDPVIDTSWPACLCVSPAATYGLFLCPLNILCSVFSVPERRHAAVLYFGKYVGSIQTPGLHCLPPCCIDLRYISTATRTMNMKNLKVLDRRGNPVVISAVVTFEPTSAKKARVDVENPWPNPSWGRSVALADGTRLMNSMPDSSSFLQLQAEAVLKQVTSQFPYEAPPGEPSLQTEGAHITEELIQRLQQRVSVTGARILSFDLVDLSYAPEIAKSMLVRQQAEALIDARKLIVQAAVEMTTDAVLSLESKTNRQLPDEVKDRISMSLLTVICSSEAVTPTLSVGNNASWLGGPSDHPQS